MKKLKDKNKKFVRICPKCGSTNIKTDFSNPVVWAYGTTTKYKCISCSYLGTIFPEVLRNEVKNYKKELDDIKKEGKIVNKKWEMVDTSTGYSVGLFEIMIIVIGLVFTLIYSFLKDRSSIILILKIGEKSNS